MAGATSNNTREAVAKAKEISARPGVDYVLTATPYYNKPTQEGVYQHFKAIAEASAKPLVLYNIAGRTGTNIETRTLLRLAEIPNIAGVKEASGNISQIAEVCATVPEDFLVFSGDDAITLAVIGLGGVGIISVVSNEQYDMFLSYLVRLVLLPSSMPHTSQPNRLWALFTTARTTALSPGQSPPSRVGAFRSDECRLVNARRDASDG